MSDEPVDREPLRRYIDHCVVALRDVKKLAAESQTRHDQMLIWSIGLMGAGAFAAYGHLPSHAGRAALAPWVFGILSAIAARLLGRIVSDKDDLIQFEKIHSLLALQLMPVDTPGMAASIKAIMFNEGDLRARRAALTRLNTYSNALAWATHILFATGVVTVAWVFACWP